jgi:hypothetical protein
MTSQKRRQSDNDLDRDAPNKSSQDDGSDVAEEMWSEAEVEQVRMGWRADDVQPEADDADDDTEGDLDLAADAITDMDAREMRRDQYHRTGGDDHNPGFDNEIDSNAPKEDDLPRKRTAGSRGQSDWH